MLACDQSDLTAPRRLFRPATDVVASNSIALPLVAVAASANDGNIPQNTIDGNLATRWSAQGDSQWIRYDLGAVAALDQVDIAWYVGDTRIASFDIQVSLDTVTWTTVFSGQSSGQTLQLESYAFPTTSGRYVRIVGHGNSASNWNSITEVAILGTAPPTLPVVAVVASANDGNVPQNTIDGSLATRWSAQGDGQWIRYDLGAVAALDQVDIAWYVGDTRIASFDIQVSLDTVTWTNVFSGQSSGQTLQLESYAFSTTFGRYVRIVGHGNSTSNWNSIMEVAILDPTTPAPPLAPVVLVTVSPASATLSVGGTAQLAAVTKDAAGNTLTGRTVTWASSNTAAATVSGSGLATGVAGGTATITATSEGQSGTAAITVTAPSCVTSAGAWQNSALAAQTGAFEARFDATPNTANMDGVVGLSNGPAAAWTDLAAIVRFNATGAIDARNGGAYAAAAAIPYTAGTAYHFRLDVNLPAHTYDIYVTPAGSTERLLGGGFAFRTEQAAVSVLNNLGLYADVGSEAGCNLAVSSWTPPPVATVTVSPAAASVAVGATLPLTATLRDSAGNVLSGRSVSWTSSTPALATVAPTGFVTGVAVGAATITATSAGKSGTAALTVTLPSASNNYYVAPTGTDANPCTASAPCYTMQRVSQFLAPGDIAHFAAGNYSWSSAQGTVSASGTATARITYISDVKWGAKITGTGPCEITRNLGDYVDIVNFDMTGPCSTGLQQDANYGRVIGNRVHDLPGWGGYAGILVDCCRYIFTGNQVLGNVVDNVGPFGQTNQIHGIYVAGPNSIIENNIVTRAAAACIHLWHNSTHEIISNNVVANCGGSGIAVSADATITTADYVTVDNNIVVMNVASTAYGIYEWPAVGTHNVFNNNIVYNCPGGCMNLISGTQSGTMTLTAAQFNALFVNYTGDMTGDYHLQSGAVAIDAGTTACAAGVTTCVPGTDFDGVLRPQGRASDIGAYEWH